MLIDETEMEDYRAALRETGCSQEDFGLWELVDHPQTGEAEGVFWENCTIIALCRKNGTARMYDAGGHGTNWVGDFEHDLRVGAFASVSHRRGSPQHQRSSEFIGGPSSLRLRAADEH